ncbi:MAG: iron uptake porin [Pleurocapsa sp. CRU_1_2]|nr:iron uptake porin [Pleurocapsa sp. CRU_1_2]
MLISRGVICQTAAVLGALLLLASDGKAIAESKNEGDVVNRLDQTNLQIINGQENFDDSDQENLSKINRKLISQSNSIKEFSDIRPTDWSYQALQNLIKRYGCLSGFSDRAYRGQQTVTRAEFAAGLNSCLNSIEKIITKTTSTPQIDIDTVLRLMQEFQSELAILQGKTDGSQARLQDLEATQFSTTSKLQGEAIFGLGSILSGDNDRTSTILGSRLRLDFKTSFQGDDLLFTRFSQSNFSGFAPEIDTFQGELAFAEPDNSDPSDLRLDTLHYSFDLGDRLGVIVGAAGLDADDIAPTINFLDGDGGSGAVSRFGSRNPLYYPPGDAGLGMNYRPSERVKIDAGYLASSANESTSGNGLFNGPYSALGQITLEPLKSLSLAAIYVHSYNQSDTTTGTSRSNLRSQTAELFGAAIPTVSNSYGLELSWAISDRIIIGGWGGLSKVKNLNTLNQQLDRGTQNIWNWAATLAIPDLIKEGSLAGIVIGSEPEVTNSTIENQEDRDRSLHLEAFYQYQVNDNIAITPGVIWITKPDSNTLNTDDLVIGTVRTTFSF